jgi:RNA polymerase sigma-70 factor (ECF subfamily)
LTISEERGGEAEILIFSGKSRRAWRHTGDDACGETFMSEPVDCELLAKLLDAHSAALELYASQWTDAPEDCVQEAFIELARQTQRPQNPAAWLFRVVRNRAISLARSHQRRRRRESLAARLRPKSDAAEAPAVDAAALSEALDALDGVEREALVARVWGELSFEQIAALLGVSTSSAHRYYLAALRSLRKQLGVSCTSRNSSTD